MKRLVFIHNYKLSWGNSVAWLNLITAQALAKRGWRCEIVSPEIKSCKNKGKVLIKGLNEQQDIAKIARRKNQLLIFNIGLTPKSIIQSFFTASQRYGTPYLVWCHTNPFNNYSQTEADYQIALGQLEKILGADLCQAVLCCSKNVSRGVKRLIKTPEKVHVFYPPINAQTNKAKGEVEPSTTGDLIFAGRLMEVKNVALLIQALAKLSIEYPRLKLTIIGEGPKEESLRQATHRLKLDARVSFIKFLPRHKLLTIIKQHKILCLPSHAESFGMVLAESLMQETPVVAANVEGIKEITRDGKYGLLFERNDLDGLVKKIRWSLLNPKLAKKMAQEGKNYVEDSFGLARQLFNIEELLLQKSYFQEIFVQKVKTESCHYA